MLDPESLMFSVDWESINEWFERRAKEAGHSKYPHSETFECPVVVDPIFLRMAEALADDLNHSIVLMYEKVLEESAMNDS